MAYRLYITIPREELAAPSAALLRSREESAYLFKILQRIKMATAMIGMMQEFQPDRSNC